MPAHGPPVSTRVKMLSRLTGCEGQRCARCWGGGAGAGRTVPSLRPARHPPLAGSRASRGRCRTAPPPSSAPPGVWLGPQTHTTRPQHALERSKDPSPARAGWLCACVALWSPCCCCQSFHKVLIPMRLLSTRARVRSDSCSRRARVGAVWSVGGCCQMTPTAQDSRTHHSHAGQKDPARVAATS